MFPLKESLETEDIARRKKLTARRRLTKQFGPSCDDEIATPSLDHVDRVPRQASVVSVGMA